jgi:hypothetical protein
MMATIPELTMRFEAFEELGFLRLEVEANKILASYRLSEDDPFLLVGVVENARSVSDVLPLMRIALHTLEAS